MRKACIVGLLGALALALACGSSEEKTAATTPSATPAATPSGPPPNSDLPKEGRSAERKAERQAAQTPAQITQGKLPGDFPPDVPVFPNSSPKTSMMVGSSGLIVLTANAPLADVLAHYREQLPSQGWTVDSVTEGSGGNKASLKAHKDARNATISITPAKDGVGTENGNAQKGAS